MTGIALKVRPVSFAALSARVDDRGGKTARVTWPVRGKSNNWLEAGKLFKERPVERAWILHLG